MTHTVDKFDIRSMTQEDLDGLADNTVYALTLKKDPIVNFKLEEDYSLFIELSDEK